MLTCPRVPRASHQHSLTLTREHTGDVDENGRRALPEGGEVDHCDRVDGEAWREGGVPVAGDHEDGGAGDHLGEKIHGSCWEGEGWVSCECIPLKHTHLAF